MARHPQITSTPVLLPCVLVVMDAVWPDLFARCLVAATRSGVLVHRCELQGAATFAAERRPVAIVLSNAVHALDPEEFNALARDVRAMLLGVDEEISERELEAMFTGALRERERRDGMAGPAAPGDGRRDDGRSYALIRQTAEEVPLPRSSQAPPSMRLGVPPSARSMPALQPRATLEPPPPSRSFASPPSRSFGPPSRSMEPPSSRSVAPPPPSRSMEPPPSRSFVPPPSRSMEPPPPSVRAEPPGSQPRASYLPPSSRSPTPSRTVQPPPPSTRALPPPPQPTQRPPPPDQGPPSVRKPPLARTSTPPPGTLRAGAPPAPSAPGEPMPRSGVRQYGRDALDAVFEEQPLPHETTAQGRRGSAT